MSFRLVTRVGSLTRGSRELATLAQAFLRAVVLSNQLTMRHATRRGSPIPPLYDSGVLYEREPGPYEEFADVLTVLRRGWGDCDDLVAWRCAELREQGHAGADVLIYWRPRKSLRAPARMHAQVRHEPKCTCEFCRGRFPKGRIEDPSRYLGM